jgi:Domain of unknown function (DUF4145)
MPDETIPMPDETYAWTCPFCDRSTTIREQDTYSKQDQLVHPLDKGRPNRYTLAAVFCPNPECKKIQLRLGLEGFSSAGPYADWYSIRQWNLLPESKAKSFPDYIPAPILADYTEACLIASLSPKASATLARRCLQGMIRDFWSIKKNRLKDEVDALEDKVDPETWEAIDSVRKIGNIGAHKEADINLIIDVDPDEADLLIGLIETLFSDWYVARYNKQERLAKIKKTAEEKQKARDGKPAESESESSGVSS